MSGGKSAVMHVSARGSSRLTQSGIVWDCVAVPVVAQYRYLGLWLHNTLKWDTHFQEVVCKVDKVVKRLMPIRT